MNILENLIQKYCPNGIEYKMLTDVCKISRGIRVTRNQLADCDKYPVYQNSMTPLGFYKKNNCTANTVFIISAGAAGEIGYSKIDFWAADDCLYFECPDYLQSRFLYFALLCKQDYLFSRVRKASVPRLSRSIVEQLKIPVPPLPVQAEIVRILDKFTELTTKLAAELAAELAARKKQYEYYRNKLLSSAKNSSIVRLGDICTLITKGTTPNYFTSSGISFIKTESFVESTVDENRLSFIDKETHLGPLKRSILKENDILITIAGATIGKSVIVPLRVLPANTNQALAIIRLNNKIMVKYVYYILQSCFMKEYLLTNIKGSAQPNLSLKQLNEFRFPLPIKSEQERIVSILDRFDKLCNDISEDLPAEIAARQKQYEYYRDKLLTFKEFENVK